MMNKIFNLLIFFSSFIFAQEISDNSSYRLTYVLDYKSDSTNSSYIQQEVFYLYVTNTDSKFISKNKIIKDSIMTDIANGGNPLGFFGLKNRPKSKNEYIVYNIKSQKLFIETIGTNNFGYTILDNPKWLMTGKQQNLEKFRADEAKTQNYLGRNWTALFDSSHSLNVGPYKFNNLPGLIVKVYDDKKDYVFTLQEVKKIDKTPIIIVEKYKLLKDREQLIQIKNNALDNPFAEAISGGIKINVDPKVMKEAIDRNKKLNSNPLELK